MSGGNEGMKKTYKVVIIACMCFRTRWVGRGICPPGEVERSRGTNGHYLSELCLKASLPAAFPAAVHTWNFNCQLRPGSHLTIPTMGQRGWPQPLQFLQETPPDVIGTPEAGEQMSWANKAVCDWLPRVVLLKPRPHLSHSDCPGNSTVQGHTAALLVWLMTVHPDWSARTL